MEVFQLLNTEYWRKRSHKYNYLTRNVPLQVKHMKDPTGINTPILTHEYMELLVLEKVEITPEIPTRMFR